MATILDQQSAQLDKVKECNIQPICRQQLLRSLRAHQYTSHQMNILKGQSAQTTARVWYLYKQKVGHQQGLLFE